MEQEIQKKTRWVFDKSHSSAEFSVRHMMISNVNGRFNEMDGFITGTPEDLEHAYAEVVIKAASVDTRDPQRDGHLKSPDFFDVNKYPEIRFVSKRIKKLSKDQYSIVGDLTIRGVTKEVELKGTFEGSLKDPWGKTRMGITVEGQIDREDWGLKWNTILETGGVLVGNKVKITVHVEAVNQ
ncbi:MAG: YceI family protein [Thermoplasmataceae archaeon]